MMFLKKKVSANKPLFKWSMTKVKKLNFLLEVLHIL